jgi:hypothetical protein
MNSSRLPVYSSPSKRACCEPRQSPIVERRSHRASMCAGHKSSTTGGNVGSHVIPSVGILNSGRPTFWPTVKKTW